jgi:hypothetical protein
MDEAAQGNFKFVVDLLVKVTAPRKPAKISPEKIAGFFIWLKNTYSLHNMTISMDWYATATTVQQLHRAGIEAETHSVDRTWEDYRNLSGSILDGCITGYNYKPLKDELFALVQDNDRKKIDHPGGGSKDICDGLVQAHRKAYEAFLEIKGGVRYFSNFGPWNIEKIRVADVDPEGINKVVCGIYFGPEAFYCVWIMVGPGEKRHEVVKDYGIEKIKKKKLERQKRIFIVSEWVDHSSTTLARASYIINESIKYGGNIVFAGDPAVGIVSRKGGDIAGSSPVREFRKNNLPVRCRRKLDRDNFDVIQLLLRDKVNPKLTMNELGCPYLITAMRSAKHAMSKGGIVKSVNMENTGREYPIVALRVALEEALIESTAEIG